jgi:hypothetical protein
VLNQCYNSRVDNIQVSKSTALQAIRSISSSQEAAGLTMVKFLKWDKNPAFNNFDYSLLNTNNTNLPDLPIPAQ